MNIYEKMGDTIIVYMPREVDDYAAVKMTAGIDGVFAEEVVRHAIFDFGRTTFMDSSGIGLITRRYRQLHDRGGSVGDKCKCENGQDTAHVRYIQDRDKAGQRCPG